MYGEYTIPSKAWAKFKQNIFEAYNAKREAFAQCGVSIYDKYKTRKIERLDSEECLSQIADNFYRRYSSLHGENLYQFKRLVCKDQEITSASKVCKPTQAMIDRYMVKAKNTSKGLELDGWGIAFDNKTRTFAIWVEECNRSVDHFFEMDNIFVDAIFRELKAVDWTRNSGGEIKFTAESFDDSPDADRDEITYIHTMGPIGDKSETVRYKRSMIY